MLLVIPHQKVLPALQLPAKEQLRLYIEDFVAKSEAADAKQYSKLRMLRFRWKSQSQKLLLSMQEALEKKQWQPEYTVQELYILFWPLLLYMGMLGVVVAFCIVCRGRNNGIGDNKLTESEMTKTQAVVLIFMYAAFGWALSNGLVLNPKIV